MVRPQTIPAPHLIVGLAGPRAGADGGDIIRIVEAPQLIDRRPRAVDKVLLIQPTENVAQFDDRTDPGYRQRMIGGKGGTPKDVSADEDRRRQGATGSISSDRRR